MAAVKHFPHLQSANQAGATAGATLVTGKVGVHAIVISGDVVNDGLVQLRDGGASGPIVMTVPCPQTGTTEVNLGEGYLPFGTDVHAVVTGTGTDVTIVYSELL